MHHVRVVLAGEDVPGAAHVRGQLVDDLDSPDHIADQRRVAQVALNKFIGRRIGELMPLQVHRAHPESLGFEPLHQVATDKAAGPIHQYSFHVRLHDDSTVCGQSGARMRLGAGLCEHGFNARDTRLATAVPLQVRTPSPAHLGESRALVQGVREHLGQAG